MHKEQGIVTIGGTTVGNKALHSELLTKLSSWFLGKFREFENSFFSKKFPNFDSRTFPKLMKTKSSENSV